MRGVPLVDRRVELQTGVGTFPSSGGNFAPEIACANGLHGRSIGDRLHVPVAVFDDRVHEVVGDAHRVVRVLVLDRERVGAVEVHVEAGITQHAGLALFLGLAPNELFDVGMVDVQDDHFRRTTRLATRLDGAGACVGAAHERHRARCGATTLQMLVARADVRQVDARTGSALEDGSLFAVPVEDSGHRVLDREDEARTRLLRDALHADVEPHRAVECGALGDEDELQFVAERLGLVGVDEVAAFDTPSGDRVGDAIDDLTQGGLALGGAERAAEVLLSDDVRRVERPRCRNLDVALLEGNRPVFPVRDARVAALPNNGVVRVHAGVGEMTADPNGQPIRCERHVVPS